MFHWISFWFCGKLLFLIFVRPSSTSTHIVFGFYYCKIGGSSDLPFSSGRKEMGWSFPDVSLEDLMKLVKGFVDILILASGYQSSGLHAHWDPHNIKKAFQWGLFFEDVCRRLRSSEEFQESVMELDAALSELTSNSYFPQGLAHLSFDSLSRAGKLVVEHLIHTMPLRNAHLRAFLNAVIEMDFDGLCETEDGHLHVYLDKLKLLDTSLNSFPGQKDFQELQIITPSENLPETKDGTCAENVFTQLTVQELLKRQLAASCISSAESSLDILTRSIWPSNWNKSDHNLSKKHLKSFTASSEEQFLGYVTWSFWMSKACSYLSDKRTIRMVSGAQLVFSAPKIQWIQVFQRMNLESDSSDHNFSEAIELLLLGCVVSRWSDIIEYIMSISYVSLPISKQYHEVCSMCRSRSLLPIGEEIRNSKETDILEYLAQKLGSQLNLLWKLPPVLAAAAIRSWSPLFRLYLSIMDAQVKGEASPVRCCSCTLEGKEHKECEIAERIWWLYIFHVCGTHLMLSDSGA